MGIGDGGGLRSKGDGWKPPRVELLILWGAVKFWSGAVSKRGEGDWFSGEFSDVTRVRKPNPGGNPGNPGGNTEGTRDDSGAEVTFLGKCNGSELITFQVQ